MQDQPSAATTATAFLMGGARARPQRQQMHPERSTWQSGLASVRGLVTGTAWSRVRTSPVTRHHEGVGLGTTTDGRPVVIPSFMSRLSSMRTACCPWSRPTQYRFLNSTLLPTCPRHVCPILIQTPRLCPKQHCARTLSCRRQNMSLCYVREENHTSASLFRHGRLVLSPE